jgi:hypothetical protein
MIYQLKYFRSYCGVITLSLEENVDCFNAGEMVSEVVLIATHAECQSLANKMLPLASVLWF